MSEEKVIREVRHKLSTSEELSDLDLMEAELHYASERLIKKRKEWLNVEGEEEANNFQTKLEADVRYVLHEAAQEVKEEGNDGFMTTRDEGHSGNTLEMFCQLEPARAAKLTKLEVAALRIYTSSVFKLINTPLRNGARPHPLALTTLHLSDALKKLRALSMVEAKFKTKYLWRGMRNRTTTTGFLDSGGSEMACMSTSENLSVVAKYAQSEAPLILRFKVETPMELGARVDWLVSVPRRGGISVSATHICEATLQARD